MGNFLGDLIEDFVEPVAPILGGILGFAGGERSNEANIEMQREAQAWSAQEAWKNRAFQAHMSNTQVERRLTDLQKAGINPILAAGSAASSPGGAMGQAFMPQIKDTITPAVNTAFQANKMMTETDLLEEQLKPLDDQIGSVKADSWLKQAQRVLANIDYNQREMAIRMLKVQIGIAEKDLIINGIKADLLREGLDQLKDTPLGDILR